MKTLDDGHLALTFEPFGGVIRGLSSVPAEGDDYPDFMFTGVVQHWTRDVVKLAGFLGEMRPRYLKLIVRLLVEQGYRWLYVSRQQGRIFPFGQVIEGGDFDGMIKVDLDEAARRWKVRS